MKLGLKRGVVELANHDPEWGMLAMQMIEKLWSIFGSTAEDIQHVGSTAIRNIKAKPIIDIAIGVKSFDDLDDVFSQLEEIGVYKSTVQPIPGDILCAVKENRESDIYVVHIEIIDSVQWHNHIDFRNYLNLFPQKANAYEGLKIKLAEQYPENREAYSSGKKAFIEEYLVEARIYAEMRQKHNIATLEPITKGWSIF